MMNDKRRRGGMGRIGDATAKKVDEELKDEELELLARTTTDWDALKPNTSDPELYARLVAVVKASTAQNESIGQLKARITGLGKGALSLAKKVVTLIR